jgi:ATP-dependent DNA ligase
MLSTTAGQLPVGDGWVLQPKWDGYRVLVEVAAGGRARAWTRHGTSLSGRVGDLEQLVAAAVPTGTILDGELVVLVAGAAGPVQSFAAIGASVFGRGRGASLRFVAFDVLCLAGEDLRARPWEQRDARLRELLADANERLTVTPTMAAAAACHQQLVALGFEGSVLKQRRSPYRSGRHASWRKHKARHQLNVDVVDVRVDADGQRRAICRAEDRSRPIHAVLLGERTDLGPAVVTYSRVDADGTSR